MHVRDLTESEREVLFALLAHLAEADERIDPAEILQIDALAEEMGVEDIGERLMRARAALRTREELLVAAARIDREESREIVQGILRALSLADGEQHAAENELIEQFTGMWAKS